MRSWNIFGCWTEEDGETEKLNCFFPLCSGTIGGSALRFPYGREMERVRIVNHRPRRISVNPPLHSVTVPPGHISLPLHAPKDVEMSPFFRLPSLSGVDAFESL